MCVYARAVTERERGRERERESAVDDCLIFSISRITILGLGLVFQLVCASQPYRQTKTPSGYHRTITSFYLLDIANQIYHSKLKKKRQNKKK